jgi:hypothetical protein
MLSNIPWLCLPRLDCAARFSRLGPWPWRIRRLWRWLRYRRRTISFSLVWMRTTVLVKLRSIVQLYGVNLTAQPPPHPTPPIHPPTNLQSRFVVDLVHFARKASVALREETILDMFDDAASTFDAGHGVYTRVHHRVCGSISSKDEWCSHAWVRIIFLHSAHISPYLPRLINPLSLFFVVAVVHVAAVVAVVVVGGVGSFKQAPSPPPYSPAAQGSAGGTYGTGHGVCHAQQMLSFIVTKVHASRKEMSTRNSGLLLVKPCTSIF